MELESLLADEKFAKNQMKNLDSSTLSNDLLNMTERSLRLSYFTQYIDDYDFNSKGVGFDAFISKYSTSDEQTKKNILYCMDCVLKLSPKIGSTFIRSYYHDAMEEINKLN